jgi:NAD(P)-dependent dehydrogenase (short-subunit alcohol dehydrogenase family)
VGGSRSFWVTGATDGLGLALVRNLLANGQRVAASAGASEELDRLCLHHGDRLLRLPGQLHQQPDADEAGRMIGDAWGSLDGLILNAATCDYVLPGTSDSELFEHLITTNLQAAQHCLEYATPLLAKGDTPQIMAVFSRYSATQLYAPTQFPAGWNNAVQWVREQRSSLLANGIALTVVAPQSLKNPVTAASAVPEDWTADTAALELLARLPAREPELVLETLNPSNLWPLPQH